MVLEADIQDIEEKHKGKTLNERQRHLLSSKLGLWPWVPNEIKQLWEEKILCFLELFSFAEKRDELLKSLSSKELKRAQDLSLVCFEKMLKNC